MKCGDVCRNENTLMNDILNRNTLYKMSAVNILSFASNSWWIKLADFVVLPNWSKNICTTILPGMVIGSCDLCSVRDHDSFVIWRHCVKKSHTSYIWKWKSIFSWRSPRVTNGLIQMQNWLLFLLLTCFLVEPLEQYFLDWLRLAKARWLPWSFSTSRVGTATPTTIESSDGRIFSRFCPFFPGFKARQLSLCSCRISSSLENVLDHLERAF